MPTTLTTTTCRRRAPVPMDLDGIADDWATFPAIRTAIGAPA
jgi:hypothetical protein